MRETESTDSAVAGFMLAEGSKPRAEVATFVAKRDAYSVSPGHTLLIPKGHIGTLFDLDERGREDLFAILLKVRDLLNREFHPDGYNIGVNTGTAAGQTVEHLHVHVMPRYCGDVAKPEGACGV